LRQPATTWSRVSMMPESALRPCAAGCGVRVTAGRCPACSRRTEQRRGSAAARGYGHHWQAFRRRFVARLVELGIVPVCGASLPTGPKTTDSLCVADGLLNGEDLDLDHDPPLTDEERKDVRAVCDMNRIQMLCGRRCHPIKTARQQKARNSRPRREWSTDVSAQHG
jgi:hypothetical protein